MFKSHESSDLIAVTDERGFFRRSSRKNIAKLQGPVFVSEIKSDTSILGTEG